MSRIYFHSFSEDAEIKGPERFYFHSLCSNITWSVLERLVNYFGDNEDSLLRNVFPKGHYALSSPDFVQAAKTFFSVGTGSPIQINGTQIGVHELSLNTAYAMGSDPVKLAARITGQCEIHAYVEGENRDWLAGIIRQGREKYIYRDNMGWESVIKLLEKDNTSPVVTSYSVCEQFPNPGIANFEFTTLQDGDFNWDEWDELSDQERWDKAVEGIRQSNKGLELKPDNWNEFYFYNGMDANKLVSELYFYSAQKLDIK